MRVTVADLQAISDRLFDHLEEAGHEAFELSDDFYWEIPEEDRYELNSDPDSRNLVVGQLSHDWERLEEILSDETLTVNYALVWYSAILRAIGEKTAG